MSGMYSTNYAKFKNWNTGNRPLPLETNFSNTSCSTARNYSYNYHFLNKDSDTFKVSFRKISEIKKAKFKIKTNVNLDKQIVRDKLESAHKEILRSNLRKNSNLENVFLTTDYNWKTSDRIKIEETSSPYKYYPKNTTENYFEYKRCATEQNNEPTKKISKTFDKIFEKRESNLEFLNKVKNTKKQKIIENILKERKERMEENYLNKLEGYKDNMSQNLTNERLLREWEYSFSAYIRHLKDQREQEKTKLDQTTKELVKIINENDIIALKIQKIQKNIDNYTQIRNFLICVKECKKELPYQFFVRINEIDEEIKAKMGIKPSIHLMSKTSETNKKFKYNKRRRVGSYLEEDEVEFIERTVNYVKENKIFNSVNEFFSLMEKLEKKSLSFIEDFNINSDYIYKINKENEILTKNVDVSFSILSNEINIKQEKLNHLKLIYSSLNETKNRLLKEESITKTEKSKPLSYYVFTQFNHIVALFKEKIPDFISSENNKLQHDQTNLKIMNVLKDVEKGMNFLLEKYKHYKLLDKHNMFSKEDKKSLQCIESKLLQERKIKKANEKMIKNQNNVEILKQKIMERAEKIVILPKRNELFKYKPRDKKNKIKDDNNDSNKEFDNLIV